MHEAQAQRGDRCVGSLAYIVDDEAYSRICIAESLLQNGYACRAFTRAADLFRAFAARAPDLIVFDASLPDLDPDHLMRSLKTNRFLGGIIPVGMPEKLARSKLEECTVGDRMTMLPRVPKPLRWENIEASLRHFDAPPPSLELAVDLHEAIHSGWTQVWYQPKVDLHSLSVVGAEALIRILHPDLGLLPPSCFMPQSTDPIMRSLLEYVVEKALSDWMSFVDERRAFEIAINVPLCVLEQPQFTSFLLKRMPLHPRFAGMIVEIDEAGPPGCPERLLELAARLAPYKVRLSVGDVDCLHTALANAQRFPFAEIKAARQYVSGCGADRLKRILCRTLVDLAHRFGARAAAVGVETGDDLAAVQEAGFDVAQGFFFGRPMPADELALRTAMHRGGFRGLRNPSESSTR